MNGSGMFIVTGVFLYTLYLTLRFYNGYNGDSNDE